MSISQNYNSVIQEIADACRKAGRDPGSVRLVCVTKGRTRETVLELLSCGNIILGESRVREASDKLYDINIKKHLIGHLQTNKVKKAVAFFDMIQSVDSIKLAKEIDRHSANLNKTMPVLVQVNISNELQKQGINADSTDALVSAVAQMRNIRLEGFMGIAPLADENAVRASFQLLKKIFDEHQKRYCLSILSMGMTEDYRIAIDEGTTMLRIGSALFL